MIRIYITDKKTKLRAKEVKYSDVLLTLAEAAVGLCHRLNCLVYVFIQMMRAAAAAENTAEESEVNKG